MIDTLPGRISIARNHLMSILLLLEDLQVSVPAEREKRVYDAKIISDAGEVLKMHLEGIAKELAEG